jgi:hypothetical protein
MKDAEGVRTAPPGRSEDLSVRKRSSTQRGLQRDQYWGPPTDAKAASLCGQCVHSEAANH